MVRATEERDLPRISDLTAEVFGLRRGVDVLAWLLTRAAGRIDSWVAERGDEIVGHTAIVRSRYGSNGAWVTGIHAFLWMADARFRGDAGMALGREIVRYGDFLIVLGGTATTQAILTGRRFEQVAQATELRLSGDAAAAADRGVRLVAGEAAGAPAPLPATVTGNEAASDHLEWLAGCPELEAARFTLERDGRPLGPVLLYVNRQASPVSGRIVHLPFLGGDADAWSAALAAIGRELARRGCQTWSVLATHPALVRACEEAAAEVAGTRPVWIREQNKILGSGSWHLTYLEGDLAYRRV
ncbi:MAG TPA: hypothetical protein VGG06_10315 [Thermoanaerobaculia bacterium]